MVALRIWKLKDSIILPLLGFSDIEPFQPSAAFNIETSKLFCGAKQMNGFYMERKTGMEWVKYMGTRRTNLILNHALEFVIMTLLEIYID